jgi:hypothetical protein
VHQFRAECAAAKTDAEVLTEAMRECGDTAGMSLLGPDEYANVVDGKLQSTSSIDRRGIDGRYSICCDLT